LSANDKMSRDFILRKRETEKKDEWKASKKEAEETKKEDKAANCGDGT
jgi:hypothetical protein